MSDFFFRVRTPKLLTVVSFRADSETSKDMLHACMQSAASAHGDPG